MSPVSSILLAFALSLDSLGVGTAYGLRRLRVPVASVSLISLTSGAVFAVAMTLGRLVSTMAAAHLTRMAGSLVLVALGTWVVVQAWAERAAANGHPGADGRVELASLYVRPAGLVIKILRDPMAADVDRSGTITQPEAVVLGLTLALDSAGAGFGAALAGWLPLWTPLFVAAAGFACLSAGLFIASRAAARSAALVERRVAGFIPGVVLLCLGFWRLL
ncbi:MAG: sporulation membrane protein YtaF [Bacillota bacterium]